MFCFNKFLLSIEKSFFAIITYGFSMLDVFTRVRQFVRLLEASSEDVFFFVFRVVSLLVYKHCFAYVSHFLLFIILVEL